MDGTLVDTEPYWIQAETGLVIVHGGSWSTDQAHALVGQSLDYSSTVLQAAGVDLDTRGIIDHLIAEVIAAVQRRIPWRPGARELLAALREADVRCAMVTMSEQPLAHEISRQLPTGSFEFLITGDAVRRGKPHPEPYLTALARLREQDAGIEACRVVALEDSIPGLASAQAAGLTTVGIPHFVKLSDGPGRTIWPTLDGIAVADVEQLAATALQSAETGGARSAFDSAQELL